MKQFKFAGVIPIIKFKNNGDRYIALVKRTPDAARSPDMHSGFFGMADESDNNDPLVTASREFAEELLVLGEGQLRTFCLGENYLPATREKVEELVRAWEELLKIEPEQLINKLNVVYVDSSCAEKVDMEDGESVKRIYIVEIDLDVELANAVFIDCEDFYGKILDRRIDIINLDDLMNWWDSQSDEKNVEVSYKTAAKIPCQKIDRNKISTLLHFALKNSKKLKTN